MRIYLAPAVMSSFNSALSKLNGYKKREYAAELCEDLTVDSEDFKELQKFIYRNPDLPKWDVLINFNANG